MDGKPLVKINDINDNDFKDLCSDYLPKQLKDELGSKTNQKLILKTIYDTIKFLLLKNEEILDVQNNFHDETLNDKLLLIIEEYFKAPGRIVTKQKYLEKIDYEQKKKKENDLKNLIHEAIYKLIGDNPLIIKNKIGNEN